MRAFLRLLSFIDLFGTPVSLLQKRNERYTTVFGALVSMGIVVFTAISFINMMADLFERGSPNVVSNVEFTPNPPVILIMMPF
jgi:hypothetical protein